MTDKSIDRNDAGAQYEALRDRIAQIVFENVGYSGDELGCQNAATEIIAALTSLVVPLVWLDFNNLGAKATAWGKANYLITRFSCGDFELVESYPGYQAGYIAESRYPTIEAAKAAANAHHVAQIMGAFATPNNNL